MAYKTRGCGKSSAKAGHAEVQKRADRMVENTLNVCESVLS